MTTPRYHHISSSYLSVSFVTNEENENYLIDRMKLELKHLKLMRDKYGYYAGNQNKFVKTLEEFNVLDNLKTAKLIDFLLTLDEPQLTEALVRVRRQERLDFARLFEFNR